MANHSLRRAYATAATMQGSTRTRSAGMRHHPPPEAGLFVLRPPGEFPPRKVRALIDILVERFG